MNPHGEWPRMALPAQVEAFANLLGPLLAPPRRTQGFADHLARGAPDAMECAGKLCIWLQLAERGVPVTLNLTANSGDAFDLRVRGGMRVNVKTSRFPPRDGLHLFIKEEEKVSDAYVQVFLHAGWAHLAGGISAGRVVGYQSSDIPKTGHRGRCIPCDDLTPWPAVATIMAEGCERRAVA